LAQFIEPADAEFAVHCVMCHADLLAALKQCIPWLHSMPLPIGDQHLRDIAAKTLNDAEIAIAHAEAE
jgi:hypothetical protein